MFKKITKTSFYIILLAVFFLVGWVARGKTSLVDTKNLPGPIKERLKPLEKYSFENLMETKVLPGKIIFEEPLNDQTEFEKRIFYMEFDPTLEGKNIKKVSGVVNTPIGEDKHPLIIMFRGYVDQKIYTSGMGTKNASEFFAKNGFITMAVDFLGYGGSDKEASNIFESRFQTYTTSLTLLASVQKIPNWDQKNIFFWGHSNGGQIALSILEITQQEIPTSLWAPVSKPFPYSILYYTDESEDQGKFIRNELSKFEADYDVQRYSLSNYFERISAPIQIHQGTLDDAVPINWTNGLVSKLKKLEKNITYFTYPGSDHNLRPGWDVVVERDLAFFKENLGLKNRS